MRPPLLLRIVGVALSILPLPAVVQGVITTIAGTDWTLPPGVTVAANAPLSNVTPWPSIRKAISTWRTATATRSQTSGTTKLRWHAMQE